MPEKILKASPSKVGYLFLIWSDRPRKVRHLAVHRAVAMAFIDNAENKPEVNHKNGIKSDNRVDNLEWVTRKENQVHSIEVLGNPHVSEYLTRALAARKEVPYSRGQEHVSSKLNEDQVVEILRTRGTLGHKRCAKLYGVSVGCIIHIRMRRIWKHITA